MKTHIALLRGINVGGNKKVPMADLKKMLEKMGYENIRTLLNSGNAIFEAPNEKPELIEKKIYGQMEKTFGFTCDVIVRPADEIQKIIKADPFKDIKVTPDTRLYVTFLTDKPKSKLKIPYVSPEKDFTILKVTDGEIISVLTLGKKGTADAMGILEKEYGNNITTRNWNTVLKLATKV